MAPRGRSFEVGRRLKVCLASMAPFLGGAEAAYEYALASIHKQKRADDPYVAHRIAGMSLAVGNA